METDPVADAVVDDFAAVGFGNGVRMLGQALDAGIDRVDGAPDSLWRLFSEVDEVPEWVDFERANAGARVFQRCGPSAALTLSAYSLMSGYHSAAAVKPLALTGRLERKAPRRLAETGRYVVATVQEDGLRRQGEGLKIAVRVRVMHAQVRRSLNADSRWDSMVWGAPINQADTALTALEFCSMVLKGARAMGHSFRSEESEDVMHLWRYGAYLMGLKPELLRVLDNEADALRYEAMVRLTSDGPDADSVALARALRAAPAQMARTAAERMEARALSVLHDGLAWKLNGAEVCGDLRIPNRRARHLIPIVARTFRAIDERRQASPSFERRMMARGNAVLKSRATAGLRGREPSFDAHSG